VARPVVALPASLLLLELTCGERCRHLGRDGIVGQPQRGGELRHGAGSACQGRQQALPGQPPPASAARLLAAGQRRYHRGPAAGLLEELLKERFSVDEVKLHEGERIDISRLFSVLLDIVRENVGRPSGVKLLLVLFAESLTANHPAFEYFNHRYDHVRQILTGHILKDPEATIQYHNGTLADIESTYPNQLFQAEPSVEAISAILEKRQIASSRG
jgi:hypothetical protein